MTSKYPLITTLETDIFRFVDSYGWKPVDQISEHFLKHFPHYRGFANFEEQVKRAYNLNCLKAGKKEVSLTTSQDVSEDKLMQLIEDAEKVNVDKLTSDDLSSTAGPLKRTRNIQGISFNIDKPDICLNEVIGLDATIKIIHNNLFESAYKEKDKGIILLGPSCCGKSMLATAFAHELKCGILAVKEYLIMGLPKKLKVIEELFNFAEEFQPVILVFGDNLLNQSSNDTFNIASKIATGIEDMSERKAQVFVTIVTCNSENIPLVLRHRLQEVYIPPLDMNGRYEILKMICKKYNYSVNFDLKEIALKTPSYMYSDLSNLVCKTQMECYHRAFSKFADNLPSDYRGCSLVHYRNHVKYDNFVVNLSKEDFISALKDHNPILTQQGFPYVPELSFDDIGGMEDIKKVLLELFVYPILHPNLYKKLSLLKKPPGLLLWGPPGCGKTMLAMAMANKAGINFLLVSAADLLDMYQGGSEKNIRKVFSRASTAAPCIIFFDEFDAICQSRDRNKGASKTSISTSLMTAIDGMNTRKDVYLIATTNRPDTLDSAILRPGRFETLYVGLPSLNERKLLLESCIKKINCNTTEGVNMNDLAEKLVNFSPADIYCVCEQADEIAFLQVDDGSNYLQKVTVTNQHFLDALKHRRPSISAADLKKYENLKSRFK